MTILDKDINANGSKIRFREAFIQRLPIGTVVENTFLATELGQKFFGTIAEGLIYDEGSNSEDVNIINVNGHSDVAVWSAVNLVRKD